MLRCRQTASASGHTKPVTCDQPQPWRRREAGKGAVTDAHSCLAKRVDLHSAVRDRAAQLTPGQVNCLLLVHQHLSSKEIAAELEISRHTVDQRIRRALQILGVPRRTEAARIIGQYFVPPADHQRSVYESIALPTPTAEDVPSAGGRHQPPPLNLPFATKSHPQNNMSMAQRLLWIVIISMCAAFSAGMYLAGLESLARLIQ